MRLVSKDLLGIEKLTREEIELILETAQKLHEIHSRDIKKVPTLRGKTVVNLFFEGSTRTRTSFEIAAKRLSADTINFSASSSSLSKSETLIDTARSIGAMLPDVIVVRHNQAGTPEMLSRMVKSSVVNAGDGAHEHPSQALLDLLTVKEKKGRFEGLKVAIVGDIAASRVARSNIYGFTKMGAEVRVAGPPTMLPPHIEQLGCKAYTNVREAVVDADVIMMLRIQMERHSKLLFPSIREYSRLYCLTPEILDLAKENAVIMHPGPINRDVEISSEIADGPYSVILEQVTNGVAVRMAILYLLAGQRSN
ncbi:MAG: aspartate carbamoyltransferase catalytic subunit [Deltaproteobacteria bacterium]|nr:aspartate carbamoyltransferase catalytic subunit [Deltaproteobacteria bacterium]